jgi:hypothetical protein
MKSAVNKFTLALGIIMMGTLLSGQAFGGCGDIKFKPGASVVPQSWDGHGLLLPVTASTDDAIVGMWHVKFTAKGNVGGPPDGTPIDNSLVLWHGDGTEMMASDRPPQDGQICMGVWKKVQNNKYRLNHIAWLANDTANAPSGVGNPTGPVRVIQAITLSPDGNQYTGTFTLRAYDLSGNQIAHVVGVISATRITISTTVGDLL